ncbi:MAG TPA: hypothetical protein VD970_02775 [Acetobacteraceae bacterium]|nr:hypothetical protein [Acetobacteraceae bacterium]
MSGDVWLYNRGATPTRPEWADRSRAPFANPLPYAREEPIFPLPTAASDVTVQWREDGTRAEIIIHGVTAGVLEAGAKPGWAAMAAKDGPLARTLPS